MYGKRPALETETQAVEMILEAQAAVARRIDRQAIGLVDDEGLAIEEQDTVGQKHRRAIGGPLPRRKRKRPLRARHRCCWRAAARRGADRRPRPSRRTAAGDRKSTRLNSSHSCPAT